MSISLMNPPAIRPGVFFGWDCARTYHSCRKTCHQLQVNTHLIWNKHVAIQYNNIIVFEITGIEHKLRS